MNAAMNADMTASNNGKKPTNRVYRIAVIPGDGIGKETVPEGVRVLEAAARKFGFELRNDDFDFASYDYYEKHQRMMPEDWKEKIGKPRRHLLRRRRLAGEDPRSHFAVGLAHPVPPRVRSIRQSAPGAADARRAVAARQSQARRHRFLGGARKYRGRIFGDRRPHVRRHRSRSRGAGDGDVARRRRPRAQIRLRARAQDAEEASHLGDQVERHRHHHAVLGRARRGNGEEFSRREVEQIPHRYFVGAVRAQARSVQRRRRLEPVRRHSLRSRSRPVPAPSASRRPAISIRSANSRPCSSRCTARRRISRGRASPIRSDKSGRAR